MTPIDRTLFAAGPHTGALLASVDAVLDEIEALPFLADLAGGTLDHGAFVYYLLQDELYLGRFGKSLALLSAHSAVSADAGFWAQSVGETIAVENEMHEALLGHQTFAQIAHELRASALAEPSPTTLGYSSYVLATCATRGYAVGVASVLPCFWIYAHVGKVLAGRAAAGLSDNPFRDWVETYDSPEYNASVRAALAIAERELAAASESARTEMFEVFQSGAVYELHFWAAAHAMQDWSAPR